MKILIPISSHLDLAFSAGAAVILHALTLGFGIGSLERAPVPLVKQVQQCESISFVSRKHHIREPVRKHKRERVMKERVSPHPEMREAEQILERRVARSPSPDRRERKKVCRTVQQKEPREKAATPMKKKAPEPEERWLKPTERSGEKNIALSRSAAPAVEKGFTFTYPRFAELQGYEGRVTLKVTVSTEGRVLHVDLLKSSGHSILDKSAMRQMRGFLFLPALDKKGVPIESTVVWSMNFDLENTRARPDF